MKNITLLSLLNLALKHIGTLILAAVIFATAAFAYCELLATPRYSATGSIIVASGAVINDNNDGKTSINNTDISASINLSDTVADILTTSGIYKQLSERVENKYTFSKLMASASVAKRDGYSLFMDITFEASSKEEAVMLVNTYLELAPDYISSFVPGTASTAAPCDVAKKVYPSTLAYTVIAALLGAVLSFLVFFMIDMLDTIIRSEEDIKEIVDIPVIGAIPDFASAKSGSNKNYYERGGAKNGR